MLTREEYKTYLRIKHKISMSDKGIQTDDEPVTIIIQRVPMGSSDSESESDSDVESGSDTTTEVETETEEEPPRGRPLKRQAPVTPLVRYYGEEKNYFKSLDNRKKRRINDLEKEIKDLNYVHVPMRFRVIESDMDIHLKGIAIQKIDQLNCLDPSSGEYFKMVTWIENLCKLPIGKYKSLPIQSHDDFDKISTFLDDVKKNLDTKVYGHQSAKNQIVRLLAKWISNPSSKGLVIGIEGAMGQGKTSLCNAICESLSLPFGFLQLGGISDGSYLVGHSYTYEGSRWGRIAEILMRVGCMNPVLYFDELDKISTTRHGEEIANMLIHLTDSSQNDKFHDKYFSDIELDLSRCLIIFSYNHSDMINPILKDRMITIKTDGYTHKDKQQIVQNYMLPTILKEFSLQPEELVLSDEVISYIITVTDEEQGVRNLKRSLEEIVSQVNLHKLLKKEILENTPLSFPLHVTKDIVNKFVQKKTENTSLPMMYL